MIKDVMVRLDGSPADELRLAAVNDLAGRFEAKVIGLYFNTLPLLLTEDEAVITPLEMLERAREAGDSIEAALRRRLARMQHPMELRRFDVFGSVISDIAVRQARTADAFVALRPNGEEDPEHFVEELLLGAGHHLYLVPNDKAAGGRLNNIVVAWDGGREAARAAEEAQPYLQQADSVTVLVVTDEDGGYETMLGRNLTAHLERHGVHADLLHVKKGDGGVGATLIREANRLGADAIAMGGYGHSRLREVILGGTTRTLLHELPLSLIVAH